VLIDFLERKQEGTDFEETITSKTPPLSTLLVTVLLNRIVVAVCVSPLWLCCTVNTLSVNSLAPALPTIFLQNSEIILLNKAMNRFAKEKLWILLTPKEHAEVVGDEVIFSEVFFKKDIDLNTQTENIPFFVRY
jgi:hypothetical protein